MYGRNSMARKGRGRERREIIPGVSRAHRSHRPWQPGRPLRTQMNIYDGSAMMQMVEPRGMETRLTEHRSLLLGRRRLSARVPSDLSRECFGRSVKELVEILVRNDLVAGVDEVDVIALELEQVGSFVQGRRSFGFGGLALLEIARGRMKDRRVVKVVWSQRE
jgi:hypothetical protein